MTVSLSWPTAATPASALPTAGEAPALPAPFRARRRELATPAGPCRLYQAPASGRPLLLVHGVHLSASSFEVRPLFEAYVGRRPVYSLDLPGFGHSTHAPGRYDAARYDAAVAAALAAVSAEHRGAPADVVALSAGSEYAAHATLRHPERVRSLVLITPTGLGAHPPVPASPWGPWTRRLAALPLLGAALWPLLSSRRALHDDLRRRFVGSVDRGLFDYAVRSTRLDGARHAALDFLAGRAFHADAFEQLYRGLPVPTLVVHDQDPSTDLARLAELRQHNPVVRSVRIAGTRGLPHFERLTETLVQLQSFFASLESARPAHAAP